MPTERKHTSSKRPNKTRLIPAPSWDSLEVEAHRVRLLASEVGRWDTYRFNLPMGEQRKRAIRVFRVLKAALDAYVTGSERELASLEKAAGKVLKRVKARAGVRAVSLSRYAADDFGWTHMLGDPVSQKGDPEGRALQVHALVHDLEWLAKRANDTRMEKRKAKQDKGPFAPDAGDGGRFADWFLLTASSLEWARLAIPNADLVLTFSRAELPRNHPASVARERVAAAFRRWSDRDGRDFEALLRAAFRAVGLTKDAAANPFKTQDTRMKRAASRPSRSNTAATVTPSRSARARALKARRDDAIDSEPADSARNRRSGADA